MSSNPVPTCTSWVQNSGTKLDLLMTNFMQSNYSQSYCYQKNISSLPYIIATTQYDPNSIRVETQQTLSMYLLRYYDNVDITVDVKYIDASTERMDLSVGGFVEENGVSYDMAGLLSFTQGEFTDWMKEDNNG